MEEQKLNTQDFKEKLLEMFDLNYDQVRCANQILKILNLDYERFQPINSLLVSRINKEYNINLTNKDLRYTLDKLESNFCFIEKHYDGQMYKISTEGAGMLQRYSDFMNYLQSKIQESSEMAVKDKKSEDTNKLIKELTIKNLSGSIFQFKNWYWILIMNAIITIIVTVISAIVIFNMGIQK
mgnify:CR=1 FL=1